jgi:sulfite reductase (ferredoxin)
MGVGECAGEIVSLTEFGLADAERALYDAQAALEGGDPGRAGRLGYDAMVQAAKALIKVHDADVADDVARVVDEFRTRLHDTRLFHDPFAGPKFAHYFLHARPDDAVDAEKAHRRVEEAALFIEAAHACYDRMQQAPQPQPQPQPPPPTRRDPRLARILE